MATKHGRSYLFAVALAIIATCLTTTTATASITDRPTITITGTAGWVNLRPNPDLQTPPSGNIPEGETSQEYICYQRGTNIGGTDLWFKVRYGEAEGFYTSFYDDVPLADQNGAILAAKYGLLACNAGQYAPTYPPKNSSYNRQAAVDWALLHARDNQPGFPGCTWFVSQALRAGNFSRSANWDNQASHGSLGWLPGTSTSTAAPLLATYLRDNYDVDIVPLGRDRIAANAVPEAQPGDIIAYVWNNEGRDKNENKVRLEDVDHLTIVTSISAGYYPNVSEWGVVTPVSSYSARGWTWSQKDNVWLNEPNKYPNVQAFLIHIKL